MDSDEEMHDANFLKDIEITFRGEQIRVNHSFASKRESDTGNLVYSCHLPGGPLRIRQYRKGDEFLWREIPGGTTQLANELGQLLEKYYLEE